MTSLIHNVNMFTQINIKKVIKIEISSRGWVLDIYRVRYVDETRWIFEDQMFLNGLDLRTKFSLILNGLKYEIYHAGLMGGRYRKSDFHITWLTLLCSGTIIS